MRGKLPCVLTTILYGSGHQNTLTYSTQKTKINTMKTRKVYADGNKPHTKKNGGLTPSNLGSRSIVGVRQAGRLMKFL